MSLEAGTLVGVYRILGPLEAGGMGQVYRGRDDRLDRDVAIKTLIVGDFPSARRHIDAAVLADASCRAFVDSSPVFAVLRSDRRPSTR